MQFLNKNRIRPKQVEDLILMMARRRSDTAAVA
jgi:hypothetical protein